MPKKIMQDVVVKKSHKGEPGPEAAHHQIAHEAHTPKRYVEEFAPTPKAARAEKKQETLIDRSPIFEKMRQRHEERGSFSDEYESISSLGIKRYTKHIIAAACVLFIGAIFAYDIIAYSATVKVTLKHSEVAMSNQEFTAEGSNTAADAIPFQVMTLSDEQYVGLAPTGEKEVKAKASGTITISNAYSAQGQTLIKNTRFLTPDGKIYRIDKQIVVPGMSGQTPGTLDVTVYADAPGSSYNVQSSTFTVPGFKGTPRYAKFTAKTKTPIAGGSEGIQKVVSENDIKQTRANLTELLRKKLLAEAEAEHPRGTVLFADAVFYTFTDSTENSNVSGQDVVKFTLKGTLRAVLFDSSALGRKIVSMASATSVGPGDQIEVQNVKELKFAWVNPGSSVPEVDGTVKFLLTGNAHAVWVLETEELRTGLLGVKTSEYQGAVTQFTGIKKASVQIRPFWKTAFPENRDKIYIETSVDEKIN